MSWFLELIGWLTRKVAGRAADESLDRWFHRRRAKLPQTAPAPAVISAAATNERFVIAADWSVEHFLNYVSLNTSRHVEKHEFRLSCVVEGLSQHSQKDRLQIIESGNRHSVVIRWENESFNPHSGETRHECLVAIRGALGPGEQPLDLAFKQRFINPVCRTYEEAVEAYGSSNWPHEYVGASSAVLRSRCRLEVQFPLDIAKALAVSPRPVVFVDSLNEVPDERKTAELRAKKGRNWGFEVGTGVAWLELDGPDPAVHYVMEWMPPRHKPKSA